MAKINNKDVLQSYVLTAAKYDFNVYEKRFLYRLVELAQSEVQGLDFRNDCRKIEHDLFGLVTVTLPIASMLKDEDDKNYKQIKDALQSLQKKLITYEDNEVWESISIIAFPVIKKYSTTVTCTLHPKIWDCMLDFSKGYRKFELVTAMQFDSIYAMRFYEVLSGQIKPLSYGIDELKERFKVTNKYSKVNDFIRYVIEPAKKELDEKSPYSFTYKMVKTGRKFTSIVFYPVYKSEHRDENLETKDLQKKTALSWDINRQVIDYLKDFGFTTKEINTHRDLFITAQNKLPDVLGDMAILKAKSREKDNPKGWFISALKGKIGDAENNPTQQTKK